MKTTGSVALLLALVSGAFGGFAANASARQEAKKGQEAAPAATPEQRLAQAKLIADGEHDPERALTLLVALGSDASVASEVRAEALVAAARCLNQLGRETEARAQLQAAAQLKGPGAEEAKRLLDGGLPDEQLELRIDKAVDAVMNAALGGNPNPEDIAKLQVSQDLIWVGAPAVPRLVRVLADVDHLPCVTVATHLLARINTPAAADAVREALAKADPFYKRAVLSAFPPNQTWSDPIRATVMTLLNDPDPHVRQWVVNDAGRLATIDELLPLTRDADANVRLAAWRAIRGQGHGTAPPEIDRVIVELRRCLKEDPDEVRREAAELFRLKGMLKSAAARELLVTTLLDDSLAVASDGRRPQWMPKDGEETNVPFDRPIPLDLLVEAAEKLGTIATIDANQIYSYASPRCELLGHMVSLSSKASVGGQIGWPAAEREKAWKLVRLGFGHEFGEWINANATSEDVPALVESAAACGDAVVMNQAIVRIAKKLTPAQRSAAAKGYLALFNADTEAWNRSGTDKRPDRWWNLAQGLPYVGDDAADRALVHVQPRVPEAGFTRWLLNRRDPPVDPQRLVELVTIPTPKDNDSSYPRNDALGRIAAAHLPELPTILARCYQLGLEVHNNGGGWPRPRGFAWLVVHEPDDTQENSSASKPGSRRSTRPPPSRGQSIRAEWGAAYSVAEVRTAFEACVQAATAGFWWDVSSVLELLPAEGPFDPVANALLELVTSKVATIPDEKLQLAGVQRSHLVEALLPRRAPNWREFALANCVDSEFGETVVRLVPELSPSLVQKVIESRDEATAKVRRALVWRLQAEKDPALRARATDFLSDPSGEVRGAAIWTILATAPDHALDLVLPLAKDSDAGVRLKLYEQLATCFDRRAIPILVDGLQDPSPGARDIAKKSLDSLQYVFEQKDKWKRMLEGAGLDSSNAAEALVKQAAATEPKAKRLIAIESLGTLGVAETLPVLINFMGEADAEVAAAAKAAVERINRRASEKESAPAGKSPPAKDQ